MSFRYHGMLVNNIIMELKDDEIPGYKRYIKSQDHSITNDAYHLAVAAENIRHHLKYGTPNVELTLTDGVYHLRDGETSREIATFVKLDDCLMFISLCRK